MPAEMLDIDIDNKYGKDEFVVTNGKWAHVAEIMPGRHQQVVAYRKFYKSDGRFTVGLVTNYGFSIVLNKDDYVCWMSLPLCPFVENEENGEKNGENNEG